MPIIYELNSQVRDSLPKRKAQLSLKNGDDSTSGDMRTISVRVSQWNFTRILSMLLLFHINKGTGLERVRVRI